MAALDFEMPKDMYNLDAVITRGKKGSQTFLVNVVNSCRDDAGTSRRGLVVARCVVAGRSRVRGRVGSGL